MAFDASHTISRPTVSRIDMLAGCTVLGRELQLARAGVWMALEQHRGVQAKARKPWFDASHLQPSTTRKWVREALAKVRAVEADVEAKYGAQVPVRGVR